MPSSLPADLSESLPPDHYRLILENIRDFAIFSADLHGRINKWNPGAERFFGYRPSEILGQPMELLYVPEDRAAGRAELEKAQAAQTGCSEDERWHLKKDGSRLFVSGVVNAMYDDQRRLCGFIKIARDITQRHETHLKLQSAQRELEKIRSELELKVVQRTTALEQTIQSLELVLYHVAHDLRAPLRAMEGFSAILVQRYAHNADREANRLTDLISDSARRMDRLIHDLLTYGRLCHEPIRRDKVMLQTAIEAALLALEAEATQTHADVQVSGALPQVWGDAHVLGQVLVQLLSNALRFSVVGRRPRIRLWAEPRGPCIRLWIEDNGVGIAPEYLDRIFWLFERLSQEDSSSTGMGLPIARKAIERMEGKLGVESSPGDGSRFWIELPAVEENVP